MNAEAQRTTPPSPSAGLALDFDVAVIVGGPSGATAANDLARAGRKVLLVDREGRIKPCGGAVPPHPASRLEPRSSTTGAAEPIMRAIRSMSSVNRSWEARCPPNSTASTALATWRADDPDPESRAGAARVPGDHARGAEGEGGCSF